MNRRNYSKEAESIIQRELQDHKVPRLLLHSCCAPCSSHCLEYLREYFDVTVFYYNPNITEQEEYEYRMREEQRLIRVYNEQVLAMQDGVSPEEALAGMHSTANARLIRIIEAPYDPERYLAAVRGMEDLPEGGDRCTVCFGLRLGRTAEEAKAGGYDYFTTTLTISPLKDAERLNRIGETMAEKVGVAWLPSDFKKKEGYKRSIELSKQFDLYRQNYCGCVFSRRGQDSGKSDRSEG